MTYYYFNPDKPQTIKEWYKKLVMIYHPDMGGDEELFKRIVSEYEILIGKRKLPKEQFETRRSHTSDNTLILFTFGKYKGTFVNNCTDVNYLTWAAAKCKNISPAFRKILMRRVEELVTY